MNILFVFYVPSGGVETLNRQRCKALKKYNVNAHCLYYENRKKNMNDHGTQTFVTNDDHEIKKSLMKEIIVLLSLSQTFKLCLGLDHLDTKEK